MRRWIDPEDSRLLVLLLRELRRWTQLELAQAAGLTQPRISQYEQGNAVPSRKSLARIAAAVGVPLALALLALPVLRLLRLACRRPGAGGEEGEAVAEVAGRVDLALSGAGAAAVEECLREIAERAGAGEPPAPPTAADRQAAAGLWALLEPRPAEGRRALVAHGRDFANWALAELLCEKSVERAADDPKEALELAELAMTAASRLPDERWRARVEGHCGPFLGNARRVLGDLREAGQAFAEGRRRREAGAGAFPGLLDETRPLDLEASLLRGERKFDAALALLDEALSQTSDGRAIARILLNRSATLEQRGRPGDAEAALAALRQAQPHVDGEREPRQLWCLLFNFAASLTDLGRAGEAAALLPEIAELTARLDRAVDGVRLRWLEGRVAAGLGEIEKAVALLEEVVARFASGDLNLPYDAALSALDLAVLLAGRGETVRVKTLARETEKIFRAKDVTREALVAVQLFADTAEREALTAGLARTLAGRLQQARKDTRRSPRP